MGLPANDRAVYERHRERIESALAGATGMLPHVTSDNRRDVFYMLTFCLAVPGGFASRARVGVEKLTEAGLYEAELPVERIAAILRPHARFHHTKARRIAKMRQEFDQIFAFLLKAQQGYITAACPLVFLRHVREQLRSQVEGLSWKEASHLLRNVGMRGLVIVDKHVLTAFFKRRLRKDTKRPATKREYEVLEDQMLLYAEAAGLTIDQLDFVWRLEGNPDALLR